MQLTTQIKLLTNDTSAKILLTTMHMFNVIGNYVSEVAFRRQTYNYFKLRDIRDEGSDLSLYYRVRELFPEANSIHVQLAIRRVADAYKIHKANGRKVRKQCTFKATSAISYNLSTLRLAYVWPGTPDIAHLTLSTVNGRIPLNAVMGRHQYRLIKRNINKKNVCETKLVYRKGSYYLHISTEQREAKLIEPTSFIGVDLGINNIATTSYGKMWSGGVIDTNRDKYQKHRSSLQKCGTKSAKRRLKLVSGGEANFRKDINHCISKEIVATSKGTNAAIVLEDLTHIRESLTVRKKQRSRQHGWSFNQLRQFISYKAQLAGMPVIMVDPSYTSQRCSDCGHTERKNRKSQFRFSCTSCGHEIHADYNAARNLAHIGHSGLAGLVR